MGQSEKLKGHFYLANGLSMLQIPALSLMPPSLLPLLQHQALSSLSFTFLSRSLPTFYPIALTLIQVPGTIILQPVHVITFTPFCFTVYLTVNVSLEKSKTSHVSSASNAGGAARSEVRDRGCDWGVRCHTDGVWNKV